MAYSADDVHETEGATKRPGDGIFAVQLLRYVVEVHWKGPKRAKH